MSAQDEQDKGAKDPEVAVGVASVPDHSKGTPDADQPDNTDPAEAVDEGIEPVTGQILIGDAEADATEQNAEGDAAQPAAAGSTANETAAAVPAGFAAELESLRSELEERVGDLQRVSAEYANYRRRVERDRALVTEQATGAVLSALLPILDDLDRARDHGDLVGPFGTMAEQLAAAVGKFGLVAFGEKGDPFDPTRHEAVAHRTSPEVTEPTCVEVMRRGYTLGERLLRPALVAVADPE